MRPLAAMLMLSISSVVSGAALGPMNWVWRAPPDNLAADGFRAIAASPTRFVAGGANGMIKVSGDGVIWEARDSGVTQRIETIRYANGRFFAFTGTASAANVGTALTSSDGEVWTRIAPLSGTSSVRSLNDVAWAGGRYVAVGYDHSVGNLVAATSADGLAWQMTTTTLSFVPRRLATDGTRFVAVSPTGLVRAVSDNGIDWTLAAGGIPSVGTQFADITFGRGLFVAVGASGTPNFVDNAGFILTSPDGRIWTDRTPARTLYRLNAVAFDGARFVAVGEATFSGSIQTAGSAAYSSSDGQIWTADPVGLEMTRPTLALRATVPAGGRFLTVGDAGVALLSRAAFDWQRIDPGLDLIGPTIYARDAFWSATLGGMLRTIDGVVWQRYPFQSVVAASDGTTRNPVLDLTTFRGVAFSGEAFVGVTGGAGVAPYYRSVDGVTWTGGVFPGPNATYYSDVATGLGQVVAVGDGGAIAVSRDHGATWTAANSGSRSVQLLRVAFGNGTFVALSEQTVHVSKDGLNWTMAPLAGPGLTNLLYFQGRFLRAATGRVLTSTEGLNWTSQAVSIPGYDEVSIGSPVAGPDGLYSLGEGRRNGVTTNVSLFSADGLFWQVTSSAPIAPLAYGGGVFLGRGDGVFSAVVGAASRLVNVSALGGVERDPLIAGFVVGGGGKSVLLRASGPALATYGVPNPIAALSTYLFNGAGVILAPGAPELLTLSTNETAAQVGGRVAAFPQTSQDHASYLRLRSGGYTYQTWSATETGGTALVEIYDADVGTEADASVITNLSARATLTPRRATLVIGFVVTGERAKTVLLRGAGPSLLRYGVPQPAADPELTLYRSGAEVLGTNDDWAQDAGARRLRLFAALRGAFALDEASKDSAFAVTLAPGAYTVEVRDRTGQGGSVLGEIYEVP